MTDTFHIILVGAGHAHLHVAANAAQLIDAGARVTLLSPGNFWYSGMASGMLGGEYSDSDDSLDPAALIEGAGGRFIRDRVIAIDRNERVLHLAKGDPLSFDLLSLNLGSRVDSPTISGIEEAQGVWPAKPIDGLYQLRELLESALADSASLPRLAVIGGGPTGVELAANLLSLSERYGRPFDISLVSASKRLLEHSPRSASAWLARRLRRRGLRIEMSASAVAYRQGQLVLDDGMQLPADHIVLATGLVAPLLTGELDLEHHPHHGLAVTPALHTPYDDRIFAVGDCAWLKDSPYPKLGVFGVRQGPILLHNLIAHLRNESFKSFHPQRRYLSILNFGDGRGMALWGHFWWPGRLAMKTKRRLDHDFMQRYRP
ncbi:NAD(P)/FAD-dependent oxidoreductase [Halomonas sp. GXIMD04776]|uniref:NAD(P)/FAD-dependent oxidoreductase n=1 Tax=Halomonas sp. GXIMD04776 TaxID=3415605 RepID=UPI003CBFFF19